MSHAIEKAEKMERVENVGSVGMTETRFHTIACPPHELKLEGEGMLGPVTVAYETYGRLNERKTNAILVLHALSGDAHAAGFHEGDDKPGWWDSMIGPGKAFDTEKYFVICSNVLGGCRGTSGPSSIDAKTNKPYGLRFPMITIADMVHVQRLLIDFLGIERLLAVAGGSMGGMQVLQWTVSYPERVCAAIPIATTMKHSPQQIAFNEVGRQAIMADPNWNKGDYYDGPLPAKGLAVARMVGHITYMSDISMAQKFGRRFKNGSKFSTFEHDFEPDFEVEGYLRYRGDNFVRRFDANSYLYITKAMDYFDLLDGKSIQEVFHGIRARFLVLAFKSDWLYPAYQSLEIVKACKMAGIEVTSCEILSTYGHDAFLVEIDQQRHLINHFLKKVASEIGVT
jgi:homoserine O-acetyltransferase